MSINANLQESVKLRSEQELIDFIVKHIDPSVLVVGRGLEFPEFKGAVFTDKEDYIDGEELPSGMTYFVVGVPKIETTNSSGVSVERM